MIKCTGRESNEDAFPSAASGLGLGGGNKFFYRSTARNMSVLSINFRLGGPQLHSAPITGLIVSCFVFFLCIIHDILCHKKNNMPIKTVASGKHEASVEFMKI